MSKRMIPAGSRRAAGASTTTTIAMRRPPYRAPPTVPGRPRGASNGAAGRAGRPEPRGAIAGGLHPGDPLPRRADLGQAGQPLGTLPGTGQQLAPAGCLDRRDEPLTILVLAELRLEADERAEQLHRPVLLAPLAQDPAEAFRARDPLGTGPVHGDVAVPFEQAHQPTDLLDRLVLLGPGQQGEQAALFEGVAALTHLLGAAAQGLEETAGIRVDAGQGRLDRKS